MKAYTLRTLCCLVEAGDTLGSIAAAFGIPIEKLMMLNPLIRNPDVIYAGESIVLSVENPPTSIAAEIRYYR